MNLIIGWNWLFDMNSLIDPAHKMKISSITLFQVCMDSGACFISCVANLPMNKFAYIGRGRFGSHGSSLYL